MTNKQRRMLAELVKLPRHREGYTVDFPARSYFIGEYGHVAEIYMSKVAEYGRNEVDTKLLSLVKEKFPEISEQIIGLLCDEPKEETADDR